MKLTDVVVNTVVLSSFEENSYVVSKRDASEAVVVDPGASSASLIKFLKSRKLVVQAVLITHGHYDHIAGVPDLKKNWPDAAVFIGEKDLDKLSDPFGNLSAYFERTTSVEVDARVVSESDVLNFADLTFKVIEIPGHSRGHVGYLLETEESPLLFCGDAVFAGSIGRTDFPDGDYKVLMDSIARKIATLPPDATLYPGHGPRTTVNDEKNSNPFFKNI